MCIIFFLISYNNILLGTVKMKKFGLICIFLIASLCAQAPDDTVKGEFLVSLDVAKAGESFWVAVNLKIEDHWHTYWKNPGSSGLATSIDWKLPEGVTAGKIQWAYPKWIESSGLVSLAYEHEVAHLVEIKIAKEFSGNEITLAGTANWLVCTDVGLLAGCYPGDANFKITLPVASEKKINENSKEFFKNAHSNLPHKKNNWKVLANRVGKKIDLFFIAPEKFTKQLSEVRFHPEQEIFNIEKTQNFTVKDNIYHLEVFLRNNAPKDIVTMSGILHSKKGWNNDQHKAWFINISVKNEIIKVKDIKSLFEKENKSTKLQKVTENKIPKQDEKNNQDKPSQDAFIWIIWANIYAAFIGGIILNAMPCVLPVISLKIFGFIEESGGDKSKIWKSGAFFTLGILVSFWILVGVLFGIREFGLFGINDVNVSWGYQLQSPIFVFIIVTGFVLFSLNLFGLFEVGTSLTTLGGKKSKKSGPAASFFTGVLTTIVATPCSAPFMAAAVGFAMAQSKLIAFIIFTSLAMGLAFPYLIISIFPGLLKFIPKPGRWMESFKQILGFPMLAAAIWLLSVFIQLVADNLHEAAEITMQTLFGLLLLTFGAWVYGRWGSIGRKKLTRIMACLLAIICVSGGFYNGYRFKDGIVKNEQWTAFSPEKVEKELAKGKPVFIDFTAAWCLTCQVNKKVALRTDAVSKKFDEYGIVTMSADWTKRSPVIGKYLKQFGRTSVPVYVFYYNDKGDYSILPQILTPNIIIKELEKRLGK